MGQWLKEFGKTNLLALSPLVSNHVDVSTQTEHTTDSMPTTETAEDPTPNYKEEPATQSAIAEKAKERYEVAKGEANELWAHEAEHEVELQQLLDARTTRLQ